MKIKLLIAGIFIFGSILSFAIPAVTSGESAQASKKSSSIATSEIRDIPIITNEAEYAKFVKMRERISSANSLSSTGKNASSSHSSETKVKD